jgi:hypothetical protein
MPDDGGSRSPEGSAATGRSRHIAVFFEDPALWPILVILVVHVALGGAVLLLAALRARNPLAMAAVAMLATLCLHAVRRARRRLRAAGAAIALWALSALVAAAGAALGVL